MFSIVFCCFFYTICSCFSYLNSFLFFNTFHEDYVDSHLAEHHCLWLIFRVYVFDVLLINLQIIRNPTNSNKRDRLQPRVESISGIHADYSHPLHFNRIIFLKTIA